MTILLASDRTLRNLNRRFRGKDQATNVLSFPAGPNPESYLGDVAIALGVTAREAKQTNRRLSDHAILPPPPAPLALLPPAALVPKW